MTGKPIPSALTPDEAWQRLLGTWCYTFKAANSLTVSRLHFTPERKMIRSNSLTGGVLPIPMTSETASDITGVSVKGDAILLALGPTPFGQPGGQVPITFCAADQIRLMDGPTYTRETENC